MRKPSSLPRVRRGGDQDQVPGGVGGEVAHQLVALVAGPLPPAPSSATQVCASSTMTSSGQWLRNSCAPVARLDEVGRHDDVRVAARTATRSSSGRVPGAAPCEGSTSSASRPNFSRSSPCHCSASAGRAQHGQPLGVALGEQLGGDQPGLDGLADADVVGDQQPHGVLAQRHHQRDELVGARLDGDAAPGTGTARPTSGTRSAARCAAAGAGWRRRGRPRVGGGKVAGSHRPRLGEHARRCRRRRRRAGAGRGSRASLSGSTTHSRPRARTSEPTAYVASGHQAPPDGTGARVPKTDGCRATRAAQSSSWRTRTHDPAGVDQPLLGCASRSACWRLSWTGPSTKTATVPPWQVVHEVRAGRASATVTWARSGSRRPRSSSQSTNRRSRPGVGQPVQQLALLAPGCDRRRRWPSSTPARRSSRSRTVCRSMSACQGWLP